MKRVEVSQALARKYPEWIILVVARDGQGRPNLMPAGWGMICSGQPPLVAVAIAPERYTHTCIEQTGEFVFAWAGEGQAELVQFAGTRSGAEVRKFEEIDIPTAEPAEINVPLLAEAAANLECRVWAAYPSGDHTIFVGEVVAAHIPEEPRATLLNFAGRFAPAVPANESE